MVTGECRGVILPQRSPWISSITSSPLYRDCSGNESHLCFPTKQALHDRSTSVMLGNPRMSSSLAIFLIARKLTWPRCSCQRQASASHQVIRQAIIDKFTINKYNRLAALFTQASSCPPGSQIVTSPPLMIT
jgi:hypothetical protein